MLHPSSYKRFVSLAAVCVLFPLLLIALYPCDLVAQESPARLFAAHALALRSAGVAGDESAEAVLANMPGAGMTGVGEMLPALFRPFFANAVVQLGRLPSAAPVALYYNPLLDIAVFTLWQNQAGGYRVVLARALPGERLADPKAGAKLLPAWMSSAADPVEVLSNTATARLEAFRILHPGQSNQAGRDTVTFAAAAADLRAALPRLVWNAEQGSRWTDEPQAWLDPTLTLVEATLAAANVDVLTAAAPDTDRETAAVLAELPVGFSGGLALDMVLEVGDKGRLLIGSLPEDGDIYVLVLCQLDRNGCELRRLMLVSLVETVS